jgi:hypothetical protein
VAVKSRRRAFRGTLSFVKRVFTSKKNLVQKNPRRATATAAEAETRESLFIPPPPFVSPTDKYKEGRQRAKKGGNFGASERGVCECESFLLKRVFCFLFAAGKKQCSSVCSFLSLSQGILF